MHFEPKAIEDADILITYRLNRDQLGNAKALKYIIVPYTGVNNFPIEAIKSMNITMLNAHGNAPYVAEHGIAMLMALMGRIIEFHNDMARGYWHRSGIYSDYWYSLRNRQIAILGTGHIGREIARILKTFSCSIMGFRMHSDNKLPDFDFMTDNIQEAIDYGNIVFLCLPLTRKTEYIIDASILGHMKGKYLVNLGRGKLIEQEPLYNALKDSILSGAAIDAWYNYPGRDNPEPLMPSDYPICSLNNTVCSPHAASHTERSEQADIEQTIDNIRQILNNNIKNNIVDINTLY